MKLEKKITGLAVVCDRGGHLHNALKLLEQMGAGPDHFLVTWGPEYAGLKPLANRVYRIPYLFSWIGKFRFLNPFKVVASFLYSGWLAFRCKPKYVISLGATNVVFYCYWAKWLGATVYHVECMNQVETPSITGRALYPIAEKVFVQWEGLQASLGPKAEYAGWVL